MKNLTPEMIEKAKAAKSAEELLELAKANGFDMSADEAKTCFAQLNPKSGELDDDALDGVAGGCGDSDDSSGSIGDTVRITSGTVCANCGSKIGILSRRKSYTYIKCNYCGETICGTDECTYEVSRSHRSER